MLLGPNGAPPKNEDECGAADTETSECGAADTETRRVAVGRVLDVRFVKLECYVAFLK